MLTKNFQESTNVMKNIFHLCLIIVACFLYQLKVSAQIWCETNATPVEQLISAVCNTTSNYYYCLFEADNKFIADKKLIIIR